MANNGQYEYEILPEEGNAIAVTLLRAVGEMGDWGVFPTPDAQIQRKCTSSLEIIPYNPADGEADPITEAYQFQVPAQSCQIPVQKGSLPLKHSYLDWEGQGLYLSGMKKSNSGEDTIVRWFNGRNKECLLEIRKSKSIGYYKSNVIEEHLEDLEAEENVIKIKVKPYEIVTVGMRRVI